MWNVSNYNSGKGMIDESFFDTIVEIHGFDQAVWVAKYFGVSLNIVKEWMKKHLKK